MNIQQDIQQALDVIKQGGIILYPTDTIWGIGCDATNTQAVNRIFQIKQRNDNKAMLCLVDTPNRIQRYVGTIPDVAWDLIELTQKPLTLILPQARNLPTQLLSNDGSIGLRVTNETYSHTLCYRLQKPIVSTSPNISGQNTPTCFAQITQQIKNSVDYIANYRQKDRTQHTPSSIIKLTQNGEITIIRK